MQPGVTFKTMDSVVNKKVYPNFKNMPVPQASALGKPYIAFTFDFATSDHLNVSKTLELYDMRGTFFVCGNNVGTTGYLTRQQLQSMQNNQHEIGGFTMNCNRLLGLSLQEQTTQIQSSYNLLNKGGLTANSFAWPYGEEIPSLFALLNQTGFRRGRDVGGYKVPNSCTSCPPSMVMPVEQTNKYVLRSFSVKSSHTLGDLMWQVWQAENWSLQNSAVNNMVIFKFETICSGCQYAPKTFELFLRWLYPRNKIGTSNEKINVL